MATSISLNSHLMKMYSQTYKTQVTPIMMIPGLKYLMRCTNFATIPCVIIFSHWESLPTKDKLFNGVKLYYHLIEEKDEDKDNEYHVTVSMNKYGSSTGIMNYIFYKDYDNIVD